MFLDEILFSLNSSNMHENAKMVESHVFPRIYTLKMINMDVYY